MTQSGQSKIQTGNRLPGSRQWLWGKFAVAAVLTLTVIVLMVNYLTWTDEQYRERCRSLSDAEQWDDLEELATEWAASSSMPDEALINLADAQLNSGKPLKAVESLLQVPRRSRRSFAALITACNLQFGPLNRPLEGVDTLKRMISQKPSSISSHQRLIFFYAVTLQREKMLKAIYDAIQLRAEPPDAYSYLMLADHLSFTNGFARNTEWLNENPGTEVFEVARIVQLIDQVQTSENADQAAGLDRFFATFQQLRRKYPRNLVLLRFGLEQATREFDVDEVAQLLRQAPARTEDSVILRYRGWLKFQQGDFEAALKQFQASLQQHALDWNTWHQLAACHRRLGDLENAEEAAARALTGKALRKELMQLENAAAISADLLARIGRYAEDCGENRVSSAIHHRLFAMGQVPN